MRPRITGWAEFICRACSSRDALREFQTSIALHPVQSEAYYELGETFLDQDQYVEANASFHKTLDRNPQHGGALVGLGIVCYKQKQFEQAEVWLRRAVQAAPDYQPGHYYLGLALGRMGRQQESRQELGTAATLAAKNGKQAAQRIQLYGSETKP